MLPCKNKMKKTDAPRNSSGSAREEDASNILKDQEETVSDELGKKVKGKKKTEEEDITVHTKAARGFGNWVIKTVKSDDFKTVVKQVLGMWTVVANISWILQVESPAVHKSNFHAIAATPARRGLSPLGSVTAALSPGHDFVKNYRAHPTHWLICAQVSRVLRQGAQLAWRRF